MRDPNDTRDIGPRVGSPLWIHMTSVTVAGFAVFAWAMMHLSGLPQLVRHPLFWVIAAVSLAASGRDDVDHPLGRTARRIGVKWTISPGAHLIWLPNRNEVDRNLML